MKTYRVVYSRGSREDMSRLRDYLAHRFTRRAASKYISRLKLFCESLCIAPHRGEERFENTTGIRTIGFERTISVAFRVKEQWQIVEIIGVYDHGRDSESAQQRDF